MIETGIDIVEVHRIEKSIENPTFIRKYYHPIEIEYSATSINAAQHFAVRFAAKEAVRKVLLSHIDKLSWTDSWIENDENGKPHLQFSENILKQVHILSSSVSLSHSKDQAIAIVLLDVKPFYAKATKGRRKT
ncbi:MAG: holo-ACP synthase [Candidatus Marinimicrobia bacterium]|nr:holo-ACP synthase [Candidatus Neomarinimicrobiota bacterium]